MRNTPIRKPQEYRRARELRLEGWSVKKIAAELHVHYDTARKWVTDLPPLRHHLSDVDEQNQEGICVHCGRVKLYRNGGKGTKWLCGYTRKASSTRSVERSQKRILEYLLDQRCADCGEDDPIVLEFDHVRGKKEHTVCDMARKGYSWEKTLAEIAKCEIVCGNCHKRRTNKRGGWYRYLNQTADV